MKEVTEGMEVFFDLVDEVVEKTGVKIETAMVCARAYQVALNNLEESKRGTPEERAAIIKGIEELYTNNPTLEMTSGDFLDYVKVRKITSNRQQFYKQKKDFLLEHTPTTPTTSPTKEAAE